MEKLILVVFGGIVLISFNVVFNVDSIQADSNFMEVKKTNEPELLIQEILDLEDLQWIYHPEIKERLPVKILASELINRNLNLKKFDQKVRILSLSEMEEEGIKDYLEFHILMIKSDTAEFDLSYKIEGASASGKFVKENGDWKIVDYLVLEH